MKVNRRKPWWDRFRTAGTGEQIGTCTLSPQPGHLYLDVLKNAFWNGCRVPIMDGSSRIDISFENNHLIFGAVVCQGSRACISFQMGATRSSGYTGLLCNVDSMPRGFLLSTVR